MEAAATGDGKAEEWRRYGRRDGVAATWGDKAEVAGAVVVADYRRGGSCGNGGRQGGTMAAVESTELVRFGPFWLAQSWSVLAGEELVRFGTELEYDRLRGWGMWGQVAGLGCGPIAGSRVGWSRVGWGGNSEPVVALFYFPFVIYTYIFLY